MRYRLTHSCFLCTRLDDLRVIQEIAGMISVH